MADLSYTVSVNTSGANAALATFQQKIAATTSKLDGFKTALAGLALGATVSSVIKYADAIADIKDTTGIAIENIQGFSRAVQLNSGTVEGAQASIVKFVEKIDEAASGSAKAQDAFLQAGISLKDLRTLSESDLLQKTIKGLSNVESLTKRVALTTDIFGKSMRGVNIQGVASGLADATARGAEYATSIQKAADIQDKLDRGLDRFRLSMIKSLEPLADFVAKLDEDQINKFVDAIIKIGGAVGGLILIAKAIEYIAAAAALAVSAFALFKTGTANLVAGFSVLMTGLRSIGTTFAITFAVLKNYAIPAWLTSGSLAGFFEAVGTTVVTLGKRFAFLIAGSAAAGVGLAAIGVGLARMLPFIGWIITGVTALDFILKKAFDFSPIDYFVDHISAAYDAFLKFIHLRDSGKEAVKVDTGAGAGRGGNADTLAAQIAQGDKLRAASEEQAKKTREATDAFAKQRLEIRNLSRDYANANALKIDAINFENTLIGKSKDYVDVARAQEDLAVSTAAKIKDLTDAKAKLTDEEKRAGLGAEYDKQIAKIEELAKKEDARIQRAIENNNRLQSVEQLRLFGIQQQIDLSNKIQSVQDEIAKSTLPEIERKYYDIQAAAKAASKAAIQAEEARIGRKLSPMEVKEYYDAAIKGAEELKKVTTDEYENARKFSTGWAQAFNDYVDNATNAANAAKDIFSKATQGMEDLIVNFAKTGKFEWRSFVNDMLETLLRSQLKQTIANIFGSLGSSGGGSSGGLFGGKIIPGFLASGGPASSNRPYIVGERGPELFVPGTNGSIVPNSELGGGGNVTYNISAVDARSFQDLVARDPQFIHAVAMAGARNTARR